MSRARAFSWHRAGDGRGFALRNVAPTITYSQAPAVWLPGPPPLLRAFTPRECERLQGLPDDWTLVPHDARPACDAPRYRAIGNGIAAPVLRSIGVGIAAAHWEGCAKRGGLRYLSLFSGIECAWVAWRRLGWRCAAVAETDPRCKSVLEHRLPGVPNLGDVTTITAARVAALGPIDLVVAGFPCQDLAAGGNDEGLGEDGRPTRSGLVFDAIRVADACRARWLLLETVPQLRRRRHEKDFARVLGTVVGRAFGVPGRGWRNTGAANGPEGVAEWAELDARDFGLPQSRVRLFLRRDAAPTASRPPVLLPEALHAARRPRGRRR